MEIKKKIGFLSYGHAKRELVHWVDKNARRLRPHGLYAMGLMAQLLSIKSGLLVNRLNSKHLGGEQQLVDMMVNGELDILFLFKDMVSPDPRDVNARTIIKLAILNHVVVACNEATADFILASPLMEQTYHAENRYSACDLRLFQDNPAYSDAG